MAVIRVLDQHTAELIAAGEVVERPASAAKELLENAIDAGATQISISIIRGGIQQIQVTDNGSGIEAEYIANAFMRHATSKISSEQDLDSIHTLGFRGEALASIASVAKVEVLTCTEQDEFACIYRIEGGREQGLEQGARPVGTTITVNDLFYNTPARMKFLKKDASEGTFVADVVQHAALSHPEISFRFIREGKQQFVTPGDGSLRSAAYAVLGRGFARDLIETDYINGVYRVYGLITPPRACRASRGAQYFYINNRYVKNRTMIAAMENAYKGTLMQGKFPGGILCLEMPVQLVDVNVHPAKTEVRFAREGEVFDAVYGAVKQALAEPGTGECRFDANENPAVQGNGLSALLPGGQIRLGEKSGFVSMTAKEYRTAAGFGYGSQSAATLTRKQNSQNEAYSPLLGARLCSPLITGAEEESETTSSPPHTVVPMEPDLIIYPEAESRNKSLSEIQKDSEKSRQTKETAEVGSPEEIKFEQTESSEQISMLQQSDDEHEPLRYVGEVFRTYIITQRGSELCLIDKHAAHERVLFEKLAENYGHVASQMLLTPAQVNLTAAEKQGLLNNETLLRDAGIELEDFGGNTVLVRGVPADVEVENIEDMVVELAVKLAQGSRDALPERTEWVLHSISCRAAIKAGDHNGPEQLLHLAEQILSGKVPPFCPHGRPVVLKITRRELEKRFGRIV